MTASRRTAIALALCLAGLAAGRGFAQFALPLGSAGTANPVMAGKDWEAWLPASAACVSSSTSATT